jgi:hypothetical protein
VRRIERMWPLVARATGYSMPPGDQELLDSFRDLRHYFEHLEDRAPGKPEQSQLVSETVDGDELRIKVGLQQDSMGRIVLGERTFDVTNRGFAAIEAVMKRNHEQMRNSCLHQVRKHFIANPSDIPAPEDVPFPSLVSLGGGPEPNQ